MESVRLVPKGSGRVCLICHHVANPYAGTGPLMAWRILSNKSIRTETVGMETYFKFLIYLHWHVFVIISGIVAGLWW